MHYFHIRAIDNLQMEWWVCILNKKLDRTRKYKKTFRVDETTGRPPSCSPWLATDWCVYAPQEQTRAPRRESEALSGHCPGHCQASARGRVRPLLYSTRNKRHNYHTLQTRTEVVFIQCCPNTIQLKKIESSAFPLVLYLYKHHSIDSNGFPARKVWDHSLPEMAREEVMKTSHQSYLASSLQIYNCKMG